MISSQGLIEGTIPVTAGSIHWVEKGEGEPLVLIHGYVEISTWRVWESNIDELSSERRVLALDLPGYGESEGKRPRDFMEWFQTYAQATREFVDTLRLGPVALCGLSAGGCSSMLAVTQQPEVASHLILVDSAGSEAADRWAKIAQPTLIVWQQEDQLIPVKAGEILHHAIPNSRLEVLHGNGAGIEPYQWHWAHALNPAKFNRLVLAFLRAPADD